MSSPDSKMLKRALFDEYGGFADKRIKKLDKGDVFIADDRDRSDHGVDRQLYPWFCVLLVQAISPTEIRVALGGNIPSSETVRSWMRENGLESTEDPPKSLEFSVQPGRQEILRSLAAAMRSIVATGAAPYSIKSYKHVCPRTAGSLERLARTLDGVWLKPDGVSVQGSAGDPAS